VAEPLPKDNRCGKCGEWFHNAHACPVQRPASPPAPAGLAEGKCGRVEIKGGRVVSYAFEQTDIADGEYLLHVAPPPVVQQASVQPARAEAMAAKLDTFIEHYDAKPSLEYIRLTRDEAFEIAHALRTTPQPAARSAVSDEQIVATLQEIADENIFANHIQDVVDAGRAVLALATQADQPLEGK